jgi:hypothetical protein
MSQAMNEVATVFSRDRVTDILDTDHADILTVIKRQFINKSISSDRKKHVQLQLYRVTLLYVFN